MLELLAELAASKALELAFWLQPEVPTWAVRLLEKLGCRIDVAANGQEALTMLAQFAYDVVFMDLPDAGDGWLCRDSGDSPTRSVHGSAYLHHCHDRQRDARRP